MDQLSPSTPPSRSLRRAVALLGVVALTLLLTACFLIEAEPAPSFTATPATITFSGLVGQSTTDTVTITNTGSGTIAVSLSDNQSWISLSESSVPLTAGQSSNVTVTITCDAVADDSGTVTAAVGTVTRQVTVNRTCTAPPPGGNYDITVETNGAGFTPQIEATFDAAAARWEQIITGDVQDITIGTSTAGCSSSASVPDRNGTTVDDILIDAVVEPIDGPGGILGSAGPCFIRTGSSTNPNLSIYGTMRFDSADVADLIADGSFDEVILHEMGHVLGIGTIWDTAGLVDYTASPPSQCRTATAFTVQPTFTGTQAVGAWAALGGAGNVPIENQYGAGTQCGHWDEETFDTELMTGFLNGASQPLADLTAASLVDLGYTVDRTVVDGYTLPACSPACLHSEDAGLDLAAGEILLFPRYAIGPDGSVEELDTTR